MGRVIVKVAPLPCSEVALIEPAACSTSCLQTARPRPVPLGAEFIVSLVIGCVTKGSNILSAIFCGMPGPESVISITASWPMVFALIMMLPPVFRSALRAFRIIFRRIWWRCMGWIRRVISGIFVLSVILSFAGSRAIQVRVSLRISGRNAV